jgi:hypothetical protein
LLIEARRPEVSATFFGRSDDVAFGHAEFFHHAIAGSGNTEAIDGDRLAWQADIFPPQTTDSLSGGGLEVSNFYDRVTIATQEIN